MKRAVLVAAAAVCAACGGTAASPSNAGSGSTPSVPTPAATSAKLKVHVSGAGRVVSAPAGLDCQTGKCPASFVEGTKLSLGAMPDPLSKTAFAGDCQGSACELTVARDLAVHVAFDQLHYQAVDLGVVDGGWWSTGGFITRQSGLVVGTWGGSNPRAVFLDGAMAD